MSEQTGRRLPNELMDEDYFAGLLAPGEWEKVYSENDVVLWTKEYVRSQVGAPLHATARPRVPETANIETRSLPGCAEVEVASPARSSFIGAHQCPHCHAHNDMSHFSSRLGGTTCQVCGAIEKLEAKEFHMRATIFRKEQQQATILPRRVTDRVPIPVHASASPRETPNQQKPTIPPRSESRSVSPPPHLTFQAPPDRPHASVSENTEKTDGPSNEAVAGTEKRPSMIGWLLFGLLTLACVSVLHRHGSPPRDCRDSDIKGHRNLRALLQLAYEQEPCPQNVLGNFRRRWNLHFHRFFGSP